MSDELATSDKGTDDYCEFSHLDWRMDPEESLSDWCIEISVDGKIHGTYHVHRTHLSVGSRSEYFTRLFATKGHKEHDKQTSRIEMEYLAAEAFPLMLDYLYILWNQHEKPITAENAVVLHYFGGYFGIPGLRKESQSFWEKSMTVSQTGTYLEHAKLFQDDDVYDAVVEKCARSIHFITVDSRLMQLSDVQFWLDVLKRHGGEPDPALSSLVSSFCMKNRDVLTVETFLKLTDKTLLPELSAAAAMDLMQLEKVYVPALASELSDLQRRGFDALMSHGNEHSLVPSTELKSSFNDLPPLVLAQMLEQSIGRLWGCNQNQQVIMRSCVPKEIVVSGAGFAAVNGAYYRANKLRERAPCFIMDGTWKGSPAKFELYMFVKFPLVRCADGSARRDWYISILEGTRPQDGNDRDFYAAPGEEGAALLPPKRGWLGFANGKWKNSEKVPTLAFRFDKFEPESDSWYL